MSRLPSRGPLNQVNSPRIVRDGTTPPTIGMPRGPMCPTRPRGVQEYNRRVANVWLAFRRGVTVYAYRETLKKLGSDMKLLIDLLWPALTQSLEIYVGSVAVGATLFGIIGAVVGEGAGAVPGAIFGAKLGSGVAMIILWFMGLKFLAAYVLAHLHEANRHFHIGHDQAWNDCGNGVGVELGAIEFGQGIADIASLVVEAAAALLIARGLRAGLKQLRESEAGRALAPYAQVQFWIKKLGITNAKIPREGLATTIKYFDEQVDAKNLDQDQWTDPEEMASYWKAMDFSKPVSEVTLKPGTELVSWRDPAYPFGYFYAEVGAFLDKLGIDYLTETKLPGGGKGLIPREFIRYQVQVDVQALKSTASGVKAWDTKGLVPGGATQYFIPRDLAPKVLKVLPKPVKGTTD